MQKNKRMIFLSLVGCVLMSGCASKEAKVVTVIRDRVTTIEQEEKKVFEPIIKDNTPAQRAVVDMGVVLKTHITAYKDNSGNLMAGHDVFFFAKTPDFVTTNTLPKQKVTHSYQGPKVDLDKSEVLNTDVIVNEESKRAEREADFDVRIEKFLQEETKRQENISK